VGLTVSDVDAAVAFWEAFLERPARARRVIDDAYVERLVGIEGGRLLAAFFDLPGGGVVELLEYSGARGTSKCRHHREPGHMHACLYITDADDAWKRALRCGAEAVDPDGPVEIDAGPHTRTRAAYVRVPPDGHVIELFEPAAP
jgi:catechol 2,3-dioxygenase-like lactoylglutathione lyase family enzyme